MRKKAKTMKSKVIPKLGVQKLLADNDGLETVESAL